MSATWILVWPARGLDQIKQKAVGRWVIYGWGPFPTTASLVYLGFQRN